MRFYSFLIREYQRVLNDRLLAPSIDRFRQHFNPGQFTDVKAVDSLIRAFVRLLQQGGAINGRVVYA